MPLIPPVAPGDIITASYLNSLGTALEDTRNALLAGTACPTVDTQIAGGAPWAGTAGTATATGWLGGTEATGHYAVLATTGGNIAASITAAGEVSIVTAPSGAGTAYLVENTPNIAAGSTIGQLHSKYGLRVQPSTAYIFSCEARGSAIEANKVGIYLTERNTATTVADIATYSTVVDSGTTEWKRYSISFTTNAATTHLRYRLGMVGSSPTQENRVQFRNIRCEQVVSIGSSIGTITPVYPAFVGTGSTAAEAASSLALATETYSLTTSITESSTHQRFVTPAQSRISRIGVYVFSKNSGGGDIKITVHDASHNVLAEDTIPYASIVDGAWNWVATSFIASGTFHIHATTSSSVHTLRSETFSSWATGSIQVEYAQPTGTPDIRLHGRRLALPTAELPEGAIVDMRGGTYTWQWTADGTRATWTRLGAVVFAASAGGSTSGQSRMHQGWASTTTSPYAHLESSSDSTDRTFTLRFDTLLPARSLRITYRGNNTRSNNISIRISTDNATWTTHPLLGGSGWNTESITNTSLAGTTTYYVQVYKTGSGQVQLQHIGIEAQLDTAGIKPLIAYPTGQALQHSSSPLLRASATRVLYRASSHGFPALEYQDSGNNILLVEYLPWDTTGCSSISINGSSIADGAAYTLPAASATPSLAVQATLPTNRLLAGIRSTAAGRTGQHARAYLRLPQAGLEPLWKS